MTTVLVDHNMGGQASILWGTIAVEGWLEIAPIELTTFAQMGLATNSSDRVVWRFAQEHGMVLLTDNRNAHGRDSLERTIEAERTATSLPVLTIGSLDRMADRDYRRRCAGRLVEIVLDLDQHLGAGRIFIP